MNGKLETVRPQTLGRRKDNRQAVALDSEQNSIQRKDVVKVVEGPHAGRQGEIRHLFRNYVFLHSRMMTENGGIFVCLSRHLVLAGGSKSSGNTTSSFSPVLSGFGVCMSPRISSTPQYSGGRGRGGGRGGGGGGMGRGGGSNVGRDRDLIGKTVKITQGPLKGHIGIVKVISVAFISLFI